MQQYVVIFSFSVKIKKMGVLCQMYKGVQDNGRIRDTGFYGMCFGMEQNYVYIQQRGYT